MVSTMKRTPETCKEKVLVLTALSEDCELLLDYKRIPSAAACTEHMQGALLSTVGNR